MVVNKLMRISYPKIVAALLALMAVLSLASIDQDDSALRSHNLNFELAETLRDLYVGHVTGQNAIAVKYGAFNSLSWANAQTQSLNMTNVYSMIAELNSFYAESTPTFTYAETSPSFSVSVTGLQNISAGLVFQAVIASNVYSQYHMIGNLDITQLSVGKDAIFRVGGPVEVTTLVYVGAPGTFALNQSQLIPATMKSWRYHTYVRSIDRGAVRILVDKIDGYQQFYFFNGALITPINTVPYFLSSFQH